MAGWLAGWLGIASCRDDRLVMLSLIRGCRSLKWQPGVRGRPCIPSSAHIVINSSAMRMHSDHSAQGQHQQPAASSTSLKCRSLTNSSLSSLAARLPDHPSRCKRSRAGHESATGRLVYFTKSRRPQANWCSRCRADKFVPMDRVWIFLSSNFSIVDSLAGSRTCRYHTVIVRRCRTFTHGGARYDYTRNVELLTDTYPPFDIRSWLQIPKYGTWALGVRSVPPGSRG
jgi:hypothetical protein